MSEGERGLEGAGHGEPKGGDPMVGSEDESVAIERLPEEASGPPLSGDSCLRRGGEHRYHPESASFGIR